QEIDGEVRDQIGDIALMLFLLAHFDQEWVMINALAREDVPIIEPGRVAEQMPFPDHPRLVSGGLQIFGQRGLAAVESVEHGDASEVAVFAGENSGTTGRADG